MRATRGQAISRGPAISGRELSNRSEAASGRPMQGAPDCYEPPRVEKVLSQAELEREILYAGFDGPSEDSDGTST